MKKHKGLYIFILTIITLAFIVFVAFMQRSFMNPEFSASGTDPVLTNTTSSKDSESTEEDAKQNTDEASVKEEESQNTGAEEDEDETPTISTKVVNVDLLTVRSEPDVESDPIKFVTMNQALEVEDINHPDGWVKVTTDEFTGYVKDKFLDDVE
ncbi:SH3 domain-containing protein [Oceanobacillus chungangensis]|uniref:SH3b domain-containing protein n=1 Tax=Oceanobacillus chungangensis TaxID=1229152 RepID=A0A3D8PXP4_9BACI|nr:SH3 domain-containing protein [Oceanobacillus chungangensis]RDW20920.1 hypothetical protein CWR45_03465 [Oceanobacillus chungangensis]